MRGTEKYAHETKLSKRVAAWQEKLEPLMQRQEHLISFNTNTNISVNINAIHCLYGTWRISIACHAVIYHLKLSKRVEAWQDKLKLVVQKQ